VPYVSIFTVPGDPDELIARKREHMDPVAGRVAPTHGGIAHIAAKTDEGLLIINLWETREGGDSAAQDPEMQAARQAAGMPAPAGRKQYELVDFRTA
jgi:hypothetical protein